MIAVSRATRDDIIRHFNVELERIDLTSEGFDSSRFNNLPNPSDKATLGHFNLVSKAYILFLGTLEPRKNVVGLVTAYHQLPDDLRQKYRLVIGGAKGWHYDAIFNSVEQLRLTDEVQFLGRVDDKHLPTLYRHAKLFVFPSFYEGFGLPVVESIACGTPVVTSNVSSLPEVCGQAGYLCDPNSPVSIHDAVYKMLSDDKFYRGIKAKTRQQAKKFSWTDVANRTLESLKRAV